MPTAVPATMPEVRVCDLATAVAVTVAVVRRTLRSVALFLFRRACGLVSSELYFENFDSGTDGGTFHHISLLAGLWTDHYSETQVD